MVLGPLQDEFRKHTQEAAQIVALRENAINMGLKGDALVAGVIDNSAAATKEAQGSISEMAEKQAKQQADDALFMAVLNDLDAQIAANNEKIAENEERIITIGEQMDVLVTLLENLEAGEVIELSEEEERILREFEDEFGISIDRSSPDSIKVALQVGREEQDRLRRDNADLRSENEAALLAKEGIEEIIGIENVVDRRAAIRDFNNMIVSEADERIVEIATAKLESASAQMEIVESRLSGEDVSQHKALISSGGSEDFFNGGELPGIFASAMDGEPDFKEPEAPALTNEAGLEFKTTL